MNYWTQLSIDFANQRNYLDKLFEVYPTIPEDIRDIDNTMWSYVETAFNSKDNKNLVKYLLDLPLFPIKDSYVAYLKRDSSAIERNPETINRLAGRLYQMGLNKIFERCSEPKETNRQIGPLFKRWLAKGTLGVPLLKKEEFDKTNNNAILDAGDAELKNYALEKLNYEASKGLDFIARFNGKYIVGEAKFLTDFGGHQNAQFNDAITLVRNKTVTAIKIAILDGVLYIKSNNQMFKFLTETTHNYNILSCLVLREFLYQI